MTESKLRQFLEDDTFLKSTQGGILQRFLDPYGEHQTLIQAVWSPNLCIFSKRMNYRNLYDTGYDPYERLTTFDGAEVYSRTVPLRGK